MTLLMALTFLIAGVACIHRAPAIARWIAGAVASLGNDPSAEPAWAKGAGLIFFIRLLGVLSLINAVMLFYLMRQAPLQ